MQKARMSLKYSSFCIGPDPDEKAPITGCDQKEKQTTCTDSDRRPDHMDYSINLSAAEVAPSERRNDAARRARVLMTTYFGYHGQLCKSWELGTLLGTLWSFEYDHRKIRTCRVLIKFDGGHTMQYGNLLFPYCSLLCCGA